MTVSENLLFQMYQMMDSVKLPEVTPSKSGKESEKSSFQDLMDQTRKDAAKTETSSQDSDEVKQTEQSDKPVEKTDSKPTEEQVEQPKLENTNYAALSYLLRPEIVMVSEEAVEQTAQQPLVTITEGESAAQALVPAEAAIVSEQTVPTQPQQQGMETAESFVPAQQAQEQTLVEPEAQQSQFTQTMHTQTEKADTLSRTDSTPVNTRDEDGEVLVSSEAPDQPVFRNVETAPVKVGENYQLDTTSPEMDTELTHLIEDAAAQGVQKLEIQLTPEHLGKIVVELTQNTDGVLQVVLHTSNAKSAGLLSEHLSSLNSALQNLGHNNQVHVEVQRNQDSASDQQPFQQADPDGRGQRQEQQQHKQSQSNPDDFLQQLRLGLFSLDESI